MKYTITVKKYAKAIVEVEADSKSIALSKAAHEYEHGSVLWEPVQCKVKIEESRKAAKSK